MAGANEGAENDDGVTPLRTAIRFKFEQDKFTKLSKLLMIPLLRNGKIPLANTLIQFGEQLESDIF